jgi:hypothetical protein
MSDTTNGNGTIPAPVERTAKGRFAKGNRLGGRPKGSRNKLSEAFLRDFHATWIKRGKKALDEVALTDPQTFLRIAAVILPRALEVDGAITVHNEFAVQIRDFRQAYELIGAQPPMIEASEGDYGDEEEQPA